MDAAWKVYVGDRRFDDNQISNLFLKLKYETVGRFTFDFRPIDGDESYMVANNTLRIFWGDLHKLDGVIQRVDWDDSQYCYHVFGADIRGFLLDRVNTEPSTVSSYTSDIQTQVQYTGCDFPSNIWTGAGDKIGTYTFHYKLGIQNTIRITSATRNIWHNVIERGTVYEHQNGCLYDATKNWTPMQYAGATLRFVSGACKNNVYNVNGNTANRVCIRLPGENADEYGIFVSAEKKTIDGVEYGQAIRDPQFESGVIQPHDRLQIDDPEGVWCEAGSGEITGDSYSGDYAATWTGSNPFSLFQGIDHYLGVITLPASVNLEFMAKGAVGKRIYAALWFCPGADTDTARIGFYSAQMTNAVSTTWAQGGTSVWAGGIWPGSYHVWLRLAPDAGVVVDDVELWIAGFEGWWTTSGNVEGKIPGCSRLGDIYEIVTASMSRIEPASLAPATLEKDNHIIKYNQTEELSDRTTVVTVMGAD